jgi:hypothetical protein
VNGKMEMIHVELSHGLRLKEHRLYIAEYWILVPKNGAMPSWKPSWKMSYVTYGRGGISDLHDARI